MGELTRYSAADLAAKLASGEIDLGGRDASGAPRAHRRGRLGRARVPAPQRAGARHGGRDRRAPSAGETLPELAGVPVAIKDVLCTVDMPIDSRFEDPRGLGSARTTQRLLPACGRRDWCRSARPTWTSSRWVPRRSTPPTVRTHNPWDLERIPGGSGGGSAAAVAAFEAPIALGSDTGGSIRQPAAVTGSVGMKPTYGGVSRYGAIALASSLDQVGPVSRTVLDSALLHDVIGGHDPRDSTSLTDVWPSFAAAARRGQTGHALKGVKVGVVKQIAEGEGFQSGVLQRFREALDTAGRRGRRDRRGQRAALRVRDRRVLPDPARRGIQQPRQVRLGAVRSSGEHSRRWNGRAGHGRHP